MVARLPCFSDLLARFQFAKLSFAGSEISGKDFGEDTLEGCVGASAGTSSRTCKRDDLVTANSRYSC